MTLLKILTFPDPRLKIRTRPVDKRDPPILFLARERDVMRKCESCKNNLNSCFMADSLD